MGTVATADLTAFSMGMFSKRQAVRQVINLPYNTHSETALDVSI